MQERWSKKVRLTVGVKQVSGYSRFDKIVTMIEESEKLKSASRKQGRTSCRQACTVYTWWNSSYLSADEKCHKGTFNPDGRFFVCS